MDSRSAATAFYLTIPRGAAVPAGYRVLRIETDWLVLELVGA